MKVRAFATVTPLLVIFACVSTGCTFATFERKHDGSGPKLAGLTAHQSGNVQDLVMKVGWPTYRISQSSHGGAEIWVYEQLDIERESGSICPFVELEREQYVHNRVCVCISDSKDLMNASYNVIADPVFALPGSQLSDNQPRIHGDSHPEKQAVDYERASQEQGPVIIAPSKPNQRN